MNNKQYSKCSVCGRDEVYKLIRADERGNRFEIQGCSNFCSAATKPRIKMNGINPVYIDKK